MNSSIYWEKRVAKKSWTIYNTLEEKNRALLEMYQEATLNISEELYKVAEKINNGKGITLSDMYKHNRLNDLQKNIEGIVKDLTENIQTFGNGNITKGFKENYNNVMNELGNIQYTVPNQKLMEQLFKKPWAGGNFSSRLWENNKVLAMNLNDILTTGLQQGKTITEISIELSNRMNKGFNVCHRLIRTETMHYLNQSSLMAYKDSGISQVEIWAAEDERMCKVCGSKHGKKYLIEKAPVLPLHSNCRCTVLPIVEEEEEDPKENNNKEITKRVNEFKPASNIKEANEWATKVLKIPNAEYKGLSVEVANEWNRGLTDTLNKYPELLTKFKFVGSMQERNKLGKKLFKDEILGAYKKMNPSCSDEELMPSVKKYLSKMFKGVKSRCYAQSWDIDKVGGVTVNNYFSDAKMFIASLEKNVKTKFHPVGTENIRSVLDHEVGHMLDNLLDISKDKEVIKIFKSMTLDEIENNLSRYSYDNTNKETIREFIAEGYAEYCNNPNPRKVATSIGEIIERKYALWKKK